MTKHSAVRRDLTIAFFFFPNISVIVLSYFGGEKPPRFVLDDVTTNDSLRRTCMEAIRCSAESF